MRDGKGEKDRVTMLPESLVAPLQDHLRIVERTHEEDLARGFGAVYLPYALERKYPNANREWVWQYVFPSRRLSVDPRSGVVRRHHLHESGLQKAVRAAARAAEIPKKTKIYFIRLLDDQLHRLVPLLSSLIVAVSNADETVTIPGK